MTKKRIMTKMSFIFVTMLALSIITAAAGDINADGEAVVPEDFIEYSVLYHLLELELDEGGKAEIVSEYPATETTEAYTRTVYARKTDGNIYIDDTGKTDKQAINFESLSDSPLYIYYIYSTVQSMDNTTEIHIGNNVIDWKSYFSSWTDYGKTEVTGYDRTSTSEEFNKYVDLFLKLKELLNDKNESVYIVTEYLATNNSAAYTRTVTAKKDTEGDIKIIDDGQCSNSSLTFESIESRSLYTYFMFDRIQSIYDIKELSTEGGDVYLWSSENPTTSDNDTVVLVALCASALCVLGLFVKKKALT